MASIQIAKGPRPGEVGHTLPRRCDGQASPVFQPQGGRRPVLEFVPLFDLGRTGHAGEVDLAGEVAPLSRIAPVIADEAEVVGGQHVDSAGFGNDNIGAGDGHVDRRGHEAIQMRFQPRTGSASHTDTCAKAWRKHVATPSPQGP